MGMLENKVAIITRAALGIGRGCVERFVREGAAVVISDTRIEPGEELAQSCRAAGGRTVFQTADVSSERDIKALVDRAVSEFGRLDIIFNNEAAFDPVGPLETTKVEDWDRCFAVGLRSVFLGIKHSVPEMRKVGGGTDPVQRVRCRDSGRVQQPRLQRGQSRDGQPDRLGRHPIGQGPDPRQLHLAGRDQHARRSGAALPGGEAEAERLFANAQPIQRIGRSADVAGVAPFYAATRRSGSPASTWSWTAERSPAITNGRARQQR